MRAAVILFESARQRGDMYMYRETASFRVFENIATVLTFKKIASGGDS